ncbi:MAG: DUF1947 domain-containing protein [Candidatus Hadarchaeales archaeon]
MGRCFLSKRETREILGKLERLGFQGKLSGGMEKIKLKGKTVFLHEGKPLCFEEEGRLFPALTASELFQLRKVVVDMGAVPHIVNGANVMAPGIVRMDPLKEGEEVLVVDEKYGKPIAVGLSTVSGEKPERGVVVRNVHHLGDEVWKIGLKSR